MKTVLITGFEPFGGYSINPSQLLLEECAGFPNKHVHIRPLLLPVDWKTVRQTLPRTVRSMKPDIVLSMGQADGRTMVSLERVAINVLHFRIPDNKGHKPLNQPIIKSGPTAYFAKMPLDRLHDTLQNHDIPAQISNTAGTYLCNQTMYLGLHASTFVKKIKICGFIHVPLLPEQVAEKQSSLPSMSFEIMKKAMEIILDTVI